MSDGNAICTGLGVGEPQVLVLVLADRHGLIAGSTGTGKTTTFGAQARGFSAASVHVRRYVKVEPTSSPPQDR